MTEHTTLITTTGALASTPAALDPLELIRTSGKAESTIRLYTGALAPYLDDGASLTDVDALQGYAAGLKPTRRRHLRAAVSLWGKETAQHLKATDTPERHQTTAAGAPI